VCGFYKFDIVAIASSNTAARPSHKSRATGVIKYSRKSVIQHLGNNEVF